ncbi:MAG: hypothetical protein ACYDDO_06705 [Acidiferrobacterales bacterium]
MVYEISADNGPHRRVRRAHCQSAFRDLIEMRYLWESEIRLDESKLTEVLDGPVAWKALVEVLKGAGLIEFDRDVGRNGPGIQNAGADPSIS